MTDIIEKCAEAIDPALCGRGQNYSETAMIVAKAKARACIQAFVEEVRPEIEENLTIRLYVGVPHPHTYEDGFNIATRKAINIIRKHLKGGDGK